MDSTTYENLEKLKSKDQMYIRFKARFLEYHAGVIKSIDNEISAILSGCDHRYPDGKSAVEGGFMYNFCKICNWNDL